MGSIPIFQMNLSALDGYTSPGLLEAIFGFALTISRKLFVARYGRGMGTSLCRSDDLDKLVRALGLTFSSSGAARPGWQAWGLEAAPAEAAQ
jgi:hypothetical protein